MCIKTTFTKKTSLHTHVSTSNIMQFVKHFAKLLPLNVHNGMKYNVGYLIGNTSKVLKNAMS